MKKLIKRIVALLGIVATGALASLTIVNYATAQTGFGVGGANLWKLVSGALQPTVSPGTIGSASDRVDAVYADLLDGTSVVIGGAVSGNMIVSGSVTAYGGFTGPTFVATSTLADSTFNRLTWVSATGTNTTSTNLFATNLSATNILSALTPTANNTYDIGSPALSWKNIYASGTSYLDGQILAGAGTVATPEYSFRDDPDTGIYRSGGDGNFVVANNGVQEFLIVAGGQTTIGGSFFPDANNTHSLGTIGQAWKDIYASGTVHGGYFSASSTTPNSTSYPTYTFEGDTDTGLSYLGTNSFGMNIGGSTKLYVNSSGNVYSSNFYPLSNNAYDLGATDNSWKNIYVSGTANLAVISADLGVGSAPSYSFKGDSNTGIYSDGAGTVYVTSDGSVKFQTGGNNYTYTHLLPATNNLYDLGTTVQSFKNIYASTSLVVPGGSAAVPSVQIGDSGTGFGIFAPVAGYSVGITTAGVQRFKCDAGDCTTSADLYVSGNANPNNNNTKDIGLASNSWRNIYASGTLSLGGAATVASLTSSGRVQSSDLLFGSTSNLLLSSESISAASSTVSGAFSFGTVGDRGVLAREFILSGETLGAGAQTLSIIESPTSTLKVTNGGTSGFGGLIAATSTFLGALTVSPPTSGTATSSIGFSSKGCVLWPSTDGVAKYVYINASDQFVITTTDCRN